jgi:hypothetical protein
LKKEAQHLFGSLGFGTLITILPFVVGGLFWADWFKSVVAFIDCLCSPFRAILDGFCREMQVNE